ncbi:MAG: helix-turn-helix domain-containing protein [Planifilum fulgidum]
MDKTFGIDGKELGAVIRAHREKRGLSIENLADENISAITISNIERGLPSVGADKTEYLMKKLGFPSRNFCKRPKNTKKSGKRPGSGFSPSR